MIHCSDLLSASHSPIKIVPTKNFKEKRCCSIIQTFLIRLLKLRPSPWKYYNYVEINGGRKTANLITFYVLDPEDSFLMTGSFILCEKTEVCACL